MGGWTDAHLRGIFSSLMAATVSFTSCLVKKSPSRSGCKLNYIPVRHTKYGQVMICLCRKYLNQVMYYFQHANLSKTVSQPPGTSHMCMPAGWYTHCFRLLLEQKTHHVICPCVFNVCTLAYTVSDILFSSLSSTQFTAMACAPSGWNEGNKIILTTFSFSSSSLMVSFFCGLGFSSFAGLMVIWGCGQAQRGLGQQLHQTRVQMHSAVSVKDTVTPSPPLQKKKQTGPAKLLLFQRKPSDGKTRTTWKGCRKNILMIWSSAEPHLKHRSSRCVFTTSRARCQY